MIALAVGTGVGINTEMAYNLGIGKKKRSDDTAGIGTPLALVMWVLFAGVCFFLEDLLKVIPAKLEDVTE